MSLLFSLPGSMWKRGDFISIVLLYLYAIFLIVNLMYCSVFNTQISIGAYGMWSNLFSFMDSVIDVFRFKFLILPVIVTIGQLVLIRFRDLKLFLSDWIVIPASIAILIISFNIPHPFRNTYGRLRLTIKENAATTISYSPFTNLIFQYIELYKSESAYSEKNINDIIKSNLTDLQDRNNGRKYDAVVLILVESLESFVIGLEIDSIPITPNLTALAHDSKTLFAPMIVPEVGIAKSMDAQLIVNCGLLPPTNEAFCYTYPSNNYPSIAKQLSDRQPIKIKYSITSDRPSIYNQSVTSKSFGYNNLITREYFTTEPPELIHVDDSTFLAQTRDMLDNSIWPLHEPAIIQLVTYSTHRPFRIPAYASKTIFNGLQPQLVRYLNAVKFTDKAIGDFIRYLQQRDDFSSMLIIITGDHNVFSSSNHKELGITKLSDYRHPYVPLIILNSSLSDIIDHEVAQSSIYPTLLELLGMTRNVWPGIGKSLFYTDSISYDRQAASNYIIRHNYTISGK